MKEAQDRHTELLSYLLGHLSAEEEKLLEAQLENDPVLHAEVLVLEEDLEKMALQNALEPPPAVRQGLVNALNTGNKNIAVKPLPTGQKFNAYFKIAAGLALLFGLTSFWLLNSLNTSRQEVNILSNRSQNLEQRLLQLEQDFSLTAGRYQVINNPNVIPIVLEGNEKLQGSRAIAYLNHQEKKVYVNSRGLPPLDDEQTYQMWADVEGVMINMGLVPVDEDLLALNYIADAESLNITIEPSGGSDHPTVENLVANVYL